VKLPLSVILWLSLGLVALSQVMILRSTVRAMREARSARARRGIEWAYAIVPAVALAVALLFTWQAAREHAQRTDMEARANQVGPS
jgi:hypothetical protein